ncbi:MAG: hypothetical protein V8Q23_00810 [Eubacteriales bacterium]
MKFYLQEGERRRGQGKTKLEKDDWDWYEGVEHKEKRSRCSFCRLATTAPAMAWLRRLTLQTGKVTGTKGF